MRSDRNQVKFNRYFCIFQLLIRFIRIFSNDNVSQMECESSGNITEALDQQMSNQSISIQTKNNMPNLNGKELPSSGDQLISDLMRTGEIQYDINNGHDKHFNDNEREQLRNDRYRELIAITNGILKDILHDTRTPQENEDHNADDADRITNSKESNDSSLQRNGIQKQNQKPAKRATPTTIQNDKLPNANDKYSVDNDKVISELMNIIQEQIDQVQLERPFVSQDAVDIEETPYYNDDEFDYIDSTAGLRNIEKVDTFAGTEENVWQKIVESLRSYKWLLGKFQQYAYSRSRGGDEFYRHRYRKDFYINPYEWRRNPYRQRFDYSPSNDNGFCYKCLANNVKAAERNFDRNWNKRNFDDAIRNVDEKLMEQNSNQHDMSTAQNQNNNKTKLLPQISGDMSIK